MPPAVIFGGANIGEKYVDKKDVEALLSTLKQVEISRIDTAGRYPPTSPGASERLLGEAHAQQLGFTIDTKIRVVGGDPAGSLRASAIEESVRDSLTRLDVEKVHTLYCHAPDPTTPLIEQATALNELYKRGKFMKLGISNFQLPMIKELLDICDSHGFIKPCVYQGQYNLFCRHSERDLIPFLRRNGISFVAFSPLAGGFLTGRFSRGVVAHTRFAEGSPGGTVFREWYDKREMHLAIAKLEKVVSQHQLTLSEAALRWVVHHSVLAEEDGVILGASQTEQIRQNAAEIGRGQLPAEVVEALEGSWEEEGVANVAP